MNQLSWVAIDCCLNNNKDRCIQCSNFQRKKSTLLAPASGSVYGNINCCVYTKITSVSKKFHLCLMLRVSVVGSSFGVDACPQGKKALPNAKNSSIFLHPHKLCILHHRTEQKKGKYASAACNLSSSPGAFIVAVSYVHIFG